MTAASTAGIWLWASGALKNILGIPFGWCLLALVGTTVLCKVAGGLILLLIGASLWPLLKMSRSRLPAIGLILVPILYLSTRATGLWAGDEAVQFIGAIFNERRASSLQFRLHNENLLVAKALESPVFGWGGWGGARVYNSAGQYAAFTDGMWVIAIGNNGLVGLTALYSALLLPMVLLVRRCPYRLLQTPEMAPVSVVSILVALYSVDCLANAMLNPIYYLALGGVTESSGRSIGTGHLPGIDRNSKKPIPINT